MIVNKEARDESFHKTVSVFSFWVLSIEIFQTSAVPHISENKSTLRSYNSVFADLHYIISLCRIEQT